MNVLERLADLRAKALGRAEAELADIERQEAEARNAAVAKMIAEDPSHRAYVARAELLYRDKMIEAKRVLALIRLADADLAKRPISDEDAALFSGSLDVPGPRPFHPGGAS